MKTHYEIQYKTNEYITTEMDQFRNKIDKKLPVMDRVVGMVIMNKAVPFQITSVQVNLDSDEKLLIISQARSRTLLTTSIN